MENKIFLFYLLFFIVCVCVTGTRRCRSRRSTCGRRSSRLTTTRCRTWAPGDAAGGKCSTSTSKVISLLHFHTVLRNCELLSCCGVWRSSFGCSVAHWGVALLIGVWRSSFVSATACRKVSPRFKSRPGALGELFAEQLR
jgi:hypothetical protein